MQICRRCVNWNWNVNESENEVHLLTLRQVKRDAITIPFQFRSSEIDWHNSNRVSYGLFIFVWQLDGIKWVHQNEGFHNMKRISSLSLWNRIHSFGTKIIVNTEILNWETKHGRNLPKQWILTVSGTIWILCIEICSDLNINFANSSQLISLHYSVRNAFTIVIVIETNLLQPKYVFIDGIICETTSNARGKLHRLDTSAEERKN